MGKKHGIVNICMVLLIICLTTLFPLLLRAAKGHGIEVRLVSQSLQEVKPGQIFTASFLVQNNSGKDIDLVDSIVLPPGWKVITSIGIPFEMASGKEEVRLLSIFVPAVSLSGDYSIAYTVQGTKDPSVFDSDTICIAVPSVFKLNISIEDSPVDAILAGESYTAGVKVISKSNIDLPVKLTAKSIQDGNIIRVTPTEFVVPANQNRPVAIHVETNKGLTRKEDHIVSLTAESEVNGQKIVARKNISTKIVPFITSNVDPYTRLKTKLSILGIMDNGHATTQFEVSGNGFIDEKKSRYVDFLLRAPDTTPNSSKFGTRDIYRFSYRDPHTRVLLGDNTYVVSPLIENGFYARGAGIDTTWGSRVSAGGFYAKTQWASTPTTESGGRLSYTFNQFFTPQLNILHKETESYTGDVYGMQIKAGPWREMTLDTEYAYGRKSQDNSQTIDATAYRIDFQAQPTANANLLFQKAHADPGFTGYYSATDYTSLMFLFPILQNLKGKFSFREQEQDPNREEYVSPTGRIYKPTTAITSRSYTGGLVWSPYRDLQVSLDYQQQESKDTLLPADFDYSEKSLRFDINKTFNKGSLLFSATHGSYDDYLKKKANNALFQYSLYGTFAPTPSQSYSLFVRTGHASMNLAPDKSTTFGGSASWRLLPNLQASLGFSANNIGADRTVERDNYTGSIAYTFKNGQSVSLRGVFINHRDEERQKERYVLMSYTIPFKIPVARKASVGALKGRLWFQEPHGPEPVVRALVSANGTVAVTNSNGEFSFPALKPGKYYLMVDRKGMGKDRITAKKLPLKVIVDGAETARYDIETVNTCRVTGRITLMGVDEAARKPDTKIPDNLVLSSDAQLKEIGGVGGVRILLSNEGEFYQKTSDDDGTFLFDDLRPGAWTISIDESDLPPRHRVETKEIEVQIKPGETKKIDFSVKPRMKKIQFLSLGKAE